MAALFWSSTTSSGLLVDLPVRLALLGFGTWIAFRERRGRVMVVLGVVFLGLVVLFRYVDAAAVRQLFALTLPWGVDGRLLMTPPLFLAPLGGLGLVRLAHSLSTRARMATQTSRWTQTQWLHTSRRALALGVGIGLASVFLVAGKFSRQTDGVVTYSSDDAAAFDWLRQHARPGDVLLNDGDADAGIWAPYKANVAIVLPHSRQVAADGPELMLRANLDDLARADVRAAACQLGVTYVYRGEANSTSEYRQFPTQDELRANNALEETFTRGEASVFHTRLDCSSAAVRR